ncbi:hypothetical protein DSL72_007398 [Monilinia vaccinii-corymbosi]|uniref:Uncharacterized protein n=1 Tax=Monilinia vaccinii-corymbosi TaxID=61207 RepID=A0A8A3PLI1_9HELO|nr:hypothetical protein DSL72_007398 [Monilinia vaccinii-corymbosi]
MSFIFRQSIRAARPVSIAVPAQRPFAHTSVRGLKESDRREFLQDSAAWSEVVVVVCGWITNRGNPTTDNPEQGAANERHKQDQLAKQKEGKNHWKPELASDSEEAVAADRHEHSDHSEKGIKELQKKTQGHAEEKHK